MKISKQSLQKVLFFIGVFVLLVSCSPQVSSTPTEETLTTQTATAEPKTEDSNAVVEQPLLLTNAQVISPEQIRLNPGITFEFNQPVNQVSFEENFSFQPDIAGTLVWENEATVVFTPDEALAPETHYSAIITAELVSESGSTLTQEITQNYLTVGALELTSKYPINQSIDIDIHSPIWVSFNQSVVSESGSDQPAPFTIEPAIPGAGRWANSSTYIYYPSEELVSDTTYTISLDNELISQNGAGYAQTTEEFSFTTESPEVTDISPEDLSTLNPGENITITFNQEMDQESVFANLRIENSEAEEIIPEITWNETSTELTINGGDYFPRGDTIKVVLNPAAKTRTGIPLHESTHREYATLPVFDIDSLPESSLTVSYNGYTTLSFHFNTPLDPYQDFLGLIDIRNRTPSDFQFELDENHQTLTYSGYFQPGTFYSYSLSPDLHDYWGQPLGEVVFKRFATQTAPASIIINQHDTPPSQIFIPQNDINIPVETTNIRRVDMQSLGLNIEDYIQLYCNTSDCLQYGEFEFDRYWYQSISPYIVNAPLPTELTMAPRTQELESGIYIFEFDSPDLKNREPLRFFGITANTHLTGKIINGELLIWAIDLNTYEPVQDAPVLIYSQSGEVLNGGTTDARGLLKISDFGSGIIHIAMYQPGHPEFGFLTVNTNEEVVPSNQGAISAGFFFDRPTYYPGDTINFLVLPEIEDSVEIKIELLYHYQGQADSIDEIVLEYSKGAGLQSSFHLPESLPLGGYSISLPEYGVEQTIPTSNETNSDVTLELLFSNEYFIFGDPISGSLKLSIDNEVPIQGQAIEWTAGLSDGSSEFTAECTTDENGMCNIELPSTYLNTLTPNQANHITFSASSEALDLMTYQTASIYPGQFQILMQAENWIGEAETPIGIEVFTQQHNQEIFPLIDLEARFEKVNFIEVAQSIDGKQVTRREMEPTQVASTSFTTDDSGYARLTFTPPDAGLYRVVIHKDAYEEDLWIYVDGEIQAKWLEDDAGNLSIISDKESYAAGETAQLYLPNPFITAAKVLLTIQSESEYREQIITIEGAGEVVDLTIKETDVPKIQLSVVFLGVDQDGISSYKLSALDIPVEQEQTDLKVEASLEFSGSDRAYFRINVADQQDNPVQATYSLVILPTDWIVSLPDDNVFYSQQALSKFASLNTLDLSDYIRLNDWQPEGRSTAVIPSLTSPTSTTKSFNGTDTIFLTNLSTNEEGASFIEFSFPIHSSEYTYVVIASSTNGLIGLQQGNVAIQSDVIEKTEADSAIISGLITTPAQKDVFLPVPHGEEDQSWRLTLYPDDLSVIQAISAQAEIDHSSPVSIISAIVSVTVMNDLFDQTQDIEPLVNKLVNSQNSDGGWGYKGEVSSDIELTVYVTFGLLETDAISLMDIESVSALEQYFGNIITSGYVNSPSIQYAYQALTLEYQNFDGSFANLGELSTSEQFYLLLGLRQQPDSTEKQMAIIDDFLSNAIYDENGIYISDDTDGKLYSSDMVSTALALITFTKTQTATDIIPEIRAWLIHEALTSSKMDAPVVNGHTLFALQQTSSTVENNDYGVAILQNESLILETTASAISNENNSIELNVNANDSLISIIHQEGIGNLYYTFHKTEQTNQMVSNGIKLEQSLYSLNNPCRPGYCSPVTDFALNENTNLVEGHLVLTIESPLQQVVIELPVTDNYEILPTAEIYSTLTPPIDSPLAYGIQQDKFLTSSTTDSVTWYASSLLAGTYEIVYFLKPLSEGSLTLQPAVGFDYLNGTLYGVSNEISFTITLENSDE